MFLIYAASLPISSICVAKVGPDPCSWSHRDLNSWQSRKSLFWALVLLALIVYVFALIFTQAVAWQLASKVNRSEPWWPWDCNAQRILITVTTVSERCSVPFQDISCSEMDLMWVKQCHKPSPSHHHFYGWYKLTIPSHAWFPLWYLACPIQLQLQALCRQSIAVWQMQRIHWWTCCFLCYFCLVQSCGTVCPCQIRTPECSKNAKPNAKSKMPSRQITISQLALALCISGLLSPPVMLVTAGCQPETETSNTESRLPRVDSNIYFSKPKLAGIGEVSVSEHNGSSKTCVCHWPFPGSNQNGTMIQNAAMSSSHQELLCMTVPPLAHLTFGPGEQEEEPKPPNGNVLKKPVLKQNPSSTALPTHCCQFCKTGSNSQNHTNHGTEQLRSLGIMDGKKQMLSQCHKSRASPKPC